MKENSIVIKRNHAGERWEDTPFTVGLSIDVPWWEYEHESDLITRIAQRAASAVADHFGVEARWNYEGSCQGHYVAPNKTLRDYIDED